jgi:hypothetical protein
LGAGDFLDDDNSFDQRCQEYSAVGFTDYANANYRLTAQSTYHNAGTDGKDLGPDWDELTRATRNTLIGNPVRKVLVKLAT